MRIVRDRKGDITAIVERGESGVEYSVYKYGSGSTYTSTDFSVVDPGFVEGCGTTKEAYRDNAGYVFEKLQEVSDAAGLTENPERFNFAVEGARAYFSDMDFADQGQLNYTYAGIMESLGSEFDGKITYSPKDVRIKGTMAETSTIDCAAYVS